MKKLTPSQQRQAQEIIRKLSQKDKKECKRIIFSSLGIVLMVMGASCMGVLRSQFGIPDTIVIVIVFVLVIGGALFSKGMFGDQHE